MAEREPYRLKLSIEELKDAISGREPQPSSVENFQFVAKEAPQLYKQILRFAGVMVAAQVLRSIGRPPIHDSTLELVKAL